MNKRPTVTLITHDELDLNILVEQIVSSSDGAVAMFTWLVRGVTRRDNQHETEYLEYEAYQPMAEAMMKQVADEIRACWNTIEGIAIVQRIGRLYPCTPTVFIACASAHRDTGVFDAARYGIDRLKQIVPVWKKEVGPNDAEWVEGDYVPPALQGMFGEKYVGSTLYGVCSQRFRVQAEVISMIKMILAHYLMS